MTSKQEKIQTTAEVADRFQQLAREEKWFEIQDELFADKVESIEPAHSTYMQYAEGKAAVRKKAEDFVKGITGLHHAFTGEAIVAANHFAVVRDLDITTEQHGRIRINQIMLYEVKDGLIISEQFFY